MSEQNGNGKIIEKIRKLLAMAERSEGNEEEAALAATKVQEILDNHNLSMSEIEGYENPDVDKIVEVGGKEKKSALLEYEVQLFTGLASAMDCYPFKRTSRYWNGMHQKMCAVGHKTDLEVFQYLHEYLKKRVEKLWRVYYKGVKHEYEGWNGKVHSSDYLRMRNSFCMAAALNVIGRVRASRKQRFQETPTGTKCQALVLARKHHVDQFVDENYEMKWTKSRRRRSHDQSAYSAGSDAGRTIPIRAGVGARSQGSVGSQRPQLN